MGLIVALKMLKGNTISGRLAVNSLGIKVFYWLGAGPKSMKDQERGKTSKSRALATASVRLLTPSLP
jgi:hypothetical protein